VTAAWVADKEKYALVGLEVKLEEEFPFQPVGPGLWAWTDQTLDVPAHWREWLGSIRAKQIENCNLVLLSKMPSQTPEILDAENQSLQRRAWGFYQGLLLSSTSTPSHAPILLTGSCYDGEIGVRQESSIDIPSLNMFRHYPPVLPAEIVRAASIAGSIERLIAAPPAGGAWRIFRALSIYIAARAQGELLDRLHQYCRCIDGLILSEPGSGLRQFKSRTELFIGPRHHDLMGKLYAIRSDVEHLHEHKYLETFDRETRLDLLQKEAIAEYIARNCLAHIIESPVLWPHFGSTTMLGPFWKLDSAERQRLWGASHLSPADALEGYNPRYISDGDLGREA
jgi:hypothetical protein